MQYHLAPVRMAFIKQNENHKCWQGCGQTATLCILGGNVKWCGHYEEEYGDSSQKLKIELPYAPTSPLLSIHPKELKSGS